MPAEKLRLREVVIVEGKYDAVALEALIDGLIIPTGGFSIFTDDEKKALIRRLGAKRGLLILTDSDAAGFRIRHYVEKIAAGCDIKHAYIPALDGKEKRKAAPSAEGTLGVEGMSPGVLREALARAGVAAAPAPAGAPVTYTQLYELGLSGGAGSAVRRRALLQRLGLPPRLSKKALGQVLGSLYTKEELMELLEEKRPTRADGAPKPVLFWDFHGTLSLPDVVWFDAAMEAAAELVPHRPLALEDLKKHLSGTCLPWYTVPSRDTRHLTGSAAWWRHSQQGFAEMFEKCGFTKEEAALLAPALREKVLQPRRYTLYPDAHSTLQTLKDRGYRSFILSNNYPELEAIVRALGLAGVVEGVLTSGLIGYDKPRPEIFEAGRKAAGHPEEVWMIGDNPADDIAGAKAAGYVTVAVHGVKASDADHTVDALAEVLALLP